MESDIGSQRGWSGRASEKMMLTQEPAVPSRVGGRFHTEETAWQVPSCLMGLLNLG